MKPLQRFDMAFPLALVHNTLMATRKKTSTKRKRNPATLHLAVKFGREEDGRWYAHIPAMPGVACYGKSKGEALVKVQALALRVIADELEQGEVRQASIAFAVA